jgi:hypothetical protein
MFRGREFEIFDEPEPGAAAALGREREQPEPEARLGESDEPAATREPNGDPALAGRWARSAAAVATLAATAATVAMLLPRGADHGDGPRAADQGWRAPLAQRPRRVQRAPLADVPSRAWPRANGHRPPRRRPRPENGLAGPTGQVAPSPPPVAQVPPARTPPPPPPAVPGPPPPPPRPVAGPTRVLVGELPAPAAPKSPFEP